MATSNDAGDVRDPRRTNTDQVAAAQPPEANWHNAAAQAWDKTPAHEALKRAFNATLGSLESASKAYWQTGDISKSVDLYKQAIQIADSIDPKIIQQHQAEVEQGLKDRNLSPQMKRELLAERQDLKDIARLPGAARANFGLALLRAGAVEQGNAWLNEAAKLDPSMKTDPHFATAAQTALTDMKTAMQRNKGAIKVDGADVADLRTTAPGATTGNATDALQQQRDADLRALKGREQQLEQDFAKRELARQQYAKDHNLQYNSAITPDGHLNFDAPAAPAAPADQHPGTPGDRPAANTDRPSPAVTDLDSKQVSPVQAALNTLQEMAKTKSMPPGGEQIFQNAIKAADAGTSPVEPTLAAAVKDLRDATAKIYDDQTKAKLTDNTKKIMGVLDQANLTDQQKPAAIAMARAIDAATSKDERQNAEAGLVKLAGAQGPQMQAALKERDDIMGDQRLNAMYDLNQKAKALAPLKIMEDNQRSATRAIYAQALDAMGQTDKAKAMLADAIVRDPQAKLAPIVAPLMLKLGVKPEGPEVAAAKQRMAAEAPAAPAAPAAPGQARPGDTSNPGPGNDAQRPAAPNDVRPPATVPTDGLTGVTAAETKAFTDANTALLASQKAIGDAAKQGDAQRNAEFAKQKPAMEQALATMNAYWDKLAPQRQQIEDQRKTALTADEQKHYTALTAQINDARSKLTDPTDKAVMNDFINDTQKTTAEQQQKFATAHPDIAKAWNERTALQDKLDPIDKKEEPYNSVMMSKIMDNAVYANDLANAGDINGAKTAFVNSFKNVPQGDTALAISGVQDLAQLAQRLNVTPSDFGLKGPEGAPDVPKTGDAKVDDLASSTSYDDLRQEARDRVKAGKLDEAEPYYRAAIAKADSTSPDQIKQKMQALETELASGQTTDQQTGQVRALTAEDRLKDHQTIGALAEISMYPMGIRTEYAEVLRSAGKFDDAGKQYSDAVQAIDRIPIDQINAEHEQLKKDMQIQDVGLRSELKKVYTQFEALRTGIDPTTTKPAGVTNPFDVTTEAAAYFVSGGVFNGQRISKDKSTVLDPAKAADIMNKYVDLQKRINGLDLHDEKNASSDQTLNEMRTVIAQNAPDQLKRKLEQEDSVWRNPTAWTVTALAGMAALTATVVLSEGRSVPLLSKLAAKLSTNGDETLSALARLNMAEGSTAARFASYGTGATLGTGTAFGANMAFNEVISPRKDWTWEDSLRQTGATFGTAALGLLLAKEHMNFQFSKYGADLTHDAIGQRVSMLLPGQAADQVKLSTVKTVFEGDADMSGFFKRLAKQNKTRPNMKVGDLYPTSQDLSTAGLNKFDQDLLTRARAMGVTDDMTLNQAVNAFRGLGGTPGVGVRFPKMAQELLDKNPDALWKDVVNLGREQQDLVAPLRGMDKNMPFADAVRVYRTETEGGLNQLRNQQAQLEALVPTNPTVRTIAEALRTNTALPDEIKAASADLQKTLSQLPQDIPLTEAMAAQRQRLDQLTAMAGQQMTALRDSTNFVPTALKELGPNATIADFLKIGETNAAAKTLADALNLEKLPADLKIKDIPTWLNANTKGNVQQVLSGIDQDVRSTDSLFQNTTRNAMLLHAMDQQTGYSNRLAAGSRDNWFQRRIMNRMPNSVQSVGNIGTDFAGGLLPIRPASASLAFGPSRARIIGATVGPGLIGNALWQVGTSYDEAVQQYQDAQKYGGPVTEPWHQVANEITTGLQNPGTAAMWVLNTAMFSHLYVDRLPGDMIFHSAGAAFKHPFMWTQNLVRKTGESYGAQLSNNAFWSSTLEAPFAGFDFLRTRVQTPFTPGRGPVLDALANSTRRQQMLDSVQAPRTDTRPAATVPAARPAATVPAARPAAAATRPAPGATDAYDEPGNPDLGSGVH